MKQITYNAQTGEVTEIEAPYIETQEAEILPQPPNLEELTAIVSELAAKLNDKGLIP